MEAWRLKMEPWRMYRTVDADSHHFEEELDADPGSAFKWNAGSGSAFQ
jgi:hypothetical protein